MLITVEATCPHVFFLTSIKVIKNDEICVEVAFLPHKHLTMTDQTASRPTLLSMSKRVCILVTLYIVIYH